MAFADELDMGAVVRRKGGVENYQRGQYLGGGVI
jgi:hypothetical protein